jgi:hypothetical protein
MSTKWRRYFPRVLVGAGIASLIVHFVIYFQTGASAFINHPEPYFTGFTIRDIHGEYVKEVTCAVGFSTYITAMLAVLLIVGGLCLSVRRSPSKP